MELYGRQWTEVKDFRPIEGRDWLVIKTDFGELWMNNFDGVMHFVTHKGINLQTNI